MNLFVKWPSIEAFKNIAYNCEKHGYFPKIHYKAKQKLHGTNAAVHFLPDGQVFAQSRNRMITPEDDNLGFAKWVSELKGLRQAKEHVIIFGEWFGKGIQNKVAISKAEGRHFAAFGAVVFENGSPLLLVEPDDIYTEILALRFWQCQILPWAFDLLIDFGDEQSKLLAMQKLSEKLAECDEQDQWALNTLGLEGPGEGFVLYPWCSENNGVVPLGKFNRYAFKAKGEKHVVQKHDSGIQPIDVELYKEVQKLARDFATEARLEQGVAELGIQKGNMQSLGNFLSWFAGDVLKEAQAELEKAGWAEDKQKLSLLKKGLNKLSKQWYLA